MKIALDIAVIAVFLITVFIITKKGFIRAIFDICRFAVSAVCAIIFKSTVSQFLMSTRVYANALESTAAKLADAIKNAGGSLTENTISGFEKSNPELAKIIQSLGGDLQKTSQVVASSAEQGTHNLAKVAADYVVVPFFEGLANILAFVLVFIAAFVAMTLAKNLLDAVFKLPVLNGLNRIGGFVVGVLCAVLYSSLLVAITSPFVTKPDAFGFPWTEEDVNSTVVYSCFVENNLFKDIFY